MLRPYQQRAISLTYDWMYANAGNPCIVLPTGAGKSHVISELCRDAITKWPETRILMLTHSKELIEQNSSKLTIPHAVYSASIGRREIGQITFAGIHSIYNKVKLLGYQSIVIIDEAHAINHKNQGMYRSLIAALTAINPALRVVGLTATPYRLGHGLITDGDALFDALIEPTSIKELVQQGYLSKLQSKSTKTQQDTSKVKTRGGDFVESELQKQLNTDDQNRAIVQEVIDRAGGRKHWLFFCTGIEHAQAVADVLNETVPAACITGKTPKAEREHILSEFKAGRITALTNANILTTGFDFPNIDLIAMLRPTMSPGLYQQMAGRGLRLKEHTDHCLVLDFAGNVAKHGPITSVHPPKRVQEGSGNGQAPVKACENCFEICYASQKTCHVCGQAFPELEKKPLRLRNDDIMGIEPQTMRITAWRWSVHMSKSGNEVLKCTYYGGLFDKLITEYFPVLNPGLPGQKSRRIIAQWVSFDQDLEQTAKLLTAAPHPESITYIMAGKYPRVLSRQ